MSAWIKGPAGWAMIDGVGRTWTIRRSPTFKLERGRVIRRYRLFCNGSRYTPTGKVWDAPLYETPRAARRAAETVSK